MMKKSNSIKNTLERYRLLCNIIENYSKDNVRCISITSNNDIEGKSMIAKNLAISLAINGKKSLLIDCSLVNSVRIKKNDITT